MHTWRSIVLLVFAVWAPLAAQSNLAHPFLRVRERAVADLRQNLAAADDPAMRAGEGLRAAAPRERAGTARALIACGALDQPAVRAALREFFDREDDETVRAAALDEVCRAILEGGEARLADLLPRGARNGPALRRAVRACLRDALERDLAKGTRWTEFRVLGRYGRLEPEAGPVLEELAFDRDRPLSLRCLAAMTLARLDAFAFWGTPQRPAKPRFLAALDASDDEVPASLKMALFYGLSMRGVDTPERMARAEKFAIDDAFGSQLIESALYYLYALPSESAKRGALNIQRACAEFADSAYSDRELYSAAQLLRRSPTVELVRKGIAEIEERDENFALYFWYCALQDNLSLLPEEERAAARKQLTDWGSDPARAVPQIRLAAFWYAEKEKGTADPNTVVTDDLVAPVRASALAVHGQHEDSDFYAQRSAALLLGIFSSDKNLPVLRRLLRHDSEAVRLAACLAANDAAHRPLLSRVEEIAAEDGDYAAYAASLTLANQKHPRGPEFLIDLVASGNRVLAPGALAKLQQDHGGAIAPDLPAHPSAWRARALQWRERLQSPPK